MYELQYWLGLEGANTKPYLFWSGSAITLSVIAASYGYYRKHKCELCFRWGHHVPALHKPRCHVHKATHIGEDTLETVIQ